MSVVSSFVCWLLVMQKMCLDELCLSSRTKNTELLEQHGVFFRFTVISSPIDDPFSDVSVNVELKERPQNGSWVLARVARLGVPAAVRWMKENWIRSAWTEAKAPWMFNLENVSNQFIKSPHGKKTKQR